MSEMNESDNNKLTLVSEKKSWTLATSEDLNFDVESLLRVRKPITNREELNDAIRLLAVHIIKFNDNNRIMRKTVAQYFVDIKKAAEHLNYDNITLGKIAGGIFREYNISESHIRRVLPHELKNQSKTNIRYKPGQTLSEEYDSSEYTDDDMGNDTEIQLKNAIERIKDVEAANRGLREQLANSIMIGQETKVYKGKVSLNQEQILPLIVAINLKEDRLEYIEIDTEAIRLAHEAS